MSLENGIIKSIKIYGDFFGLKDVSVLEECLLGLRYDKKDIEKTIDNGILNECISGMTVELFTELLFS